jgi:signal transduction histidine kinase
MVGRDPGEIESTRVDTNPLRWRVFHVDDSRLAAPEELPLTRAIQEGRTVIDEEWLVEDQHGKKSFALFNAGPIKDRSGEVTGGVAVWRDITERKKSEAELLAAKERLIRQEKLAYLGALAGGVGHELRTPLGSIANAAYFLKLVIDEPSEEVQEATTILQREVATAESIITALLDFARPRSPRREQVDVSDLLRRTLAKLEVPESVEVSWSLGALAPISVDPGQVAQVLGNILTNALQAMPDGGELTISTAPGSSGGKSVDISISDTGPGIPDEEMDELFEPLFTTKARGIGLGLSVAQTLVQRHGGRIHVESSRGQGTTFTVRLPAGEPLEGSQP